MPFQNMSKVVGGRKLKQKVFAGDCKQRETYAVFCQSIEFLKRKNIYIHERCQAVPLECRIKNNSNKK